MIQKFVDRFLARRDELKAKIAENPPSRYIDLVKLVIATISDDSEEAYFNDTPDPDRIHEVDDGHYQGTLVYVIAQAGYQPSKYWYVLVSYGSCSGCDALQSIRGYSDEPVSDEQVVE